MSRPPFSQRLRASRKATGLSQKDAADALVELDIETSERSIAGYERGERAPSAMKQSQLLTGLEQIAATLQSQVAGDKEVADERASVSRSPASETIVHVPTAPYGHSASFDGASDNTDGDTRLTPYYEDQLQRMIGGDLPRDSEGNVALRLSFAVGDSMAPFIPDGAPFLYVQGGAFVDGARYAMWLGPTQADVIKRVEIHGGGVVHLVSDNPAVGRRILRTGDEDGVWLDEEGRDYDLTIQGRVVWPLDTPQAVVGQIADRLAEFARSFSR